MKKILVTTLLALLVAMLVVGSASAQKDKVNIKGEVISFDAGTLTVQSNKGETFVVIVPAGFDMSAIQVGTSVLIKGRTAQDGSIEADSIKLVGKGSHDGNGDNDDEKEKPEGFKDNSAFCAEGKQVKPHPLAAKMAERYGVTEEWVMSRFCEGYSIGAIMLAIRTSQIEGMTATPDDLLAKRTAGNGWGLIWKELGLIGSENSGQSPPGLLKKPDHAGPKNK
jgi:RNase P/RNase MRP subunit p29